MKPSFLLYALALFLQVLSISVVAQAPPSGFASVTVSNNWTEAVGIAFSPDGSKMFVWERGGKVWIVVNNQKQLLLDISEEVGGWWDHGLLGFVLDPHFEENGYFYLHYLVDRHHLINYGTGAYNPATNDFYSATISRLTRYTATPSGNTYIVNPDSRKILMGDTKTTGPASTERSHVVGAIAFGTDHTLLVGVGDGAAANTDLGSYSGSYYAQALADGILTPALNIGVFRSQVLDCLNGKILRIDPETGAGIPSNPFFDPLRPDAPISKVWALGVRQPFRLMHKEGTGSHSPEDGDPGVFYIGEVGYNTWEELNVMDKPGMNFGWPIFEGLTPSVFATVNMANTFAPNPLYLTNGCTQQYFNFQDLIKQQTPSGTATFTNPCNATQGIPSSIPTFVHTRPIIDWRHGGSPSRTGTFSGQTATEANIGAAGSPVSGPQFGGAASVAGVFYTGTDFPEIYQNTFFFGDYASGWIRNLTVDGNNRPVAVRNFVNSGATVVCFATNPAGEGLYYVNFGSEIRRIYYTANRPPVAVASSDKTYGASSPLQVQFTGNASSDPEDQPLTYSWDFGDGSGLNTSANPSHTFSAPPGVPTKYIVKLTVRDNQNATDETTIVISVNNTPPDVTITSPENNTLYPLTGETIYQLQATVTDSEHSAAQLSYAWQTILHHNEHEHPDPIDTSPSTTAHVAPLGCDGQTYFTRIVLTVTDAAGASTTKEVRVYPDCTGIMLDPQLTWTAPTPITQGTALGAGQLNATASYNGTPVVGTFEYTPAPGTVLNVGNGQQLSVTFTPSNTSLFNVVSKTVAIDVLPSANGIYRAINVNGPALLIDGFSWEPGASAPNVTYSSASAFANQAVPLVPATDANRSTMIRSSIYGRSWNVTMSAVPAATYQVWLYVWEDNNPETFSVSLEGTVVQANYNSGTAGTWRKLGPYQAIINDGAINLAFSGGTSNLSGIEVWRLGAPVGNQPPVVANPIADRSTPAEAPFSFTFPTNTFSDPDAGTVLAYSASLSPSGTLPAWLIFNPATRTFSGTPAAANVSTIQIQVTASDGAGGSINDVFALTITPPAPNQPPVVSNAIADQSTNAAVPFSFTFPANTFTDPNAGTVLIYTASLSPSGSLPAWLSFNASTRTFSGTPAAGDVGTLQIQVTASDGIVGGTVSDVFALTINPPAAIALYRAINLNGPALVIDGNNWEAGTGAPGLSYTNGTAFANQAVTLVPATDANRATMIRSSVYGNGWTLTLGSIPAGTYQVYLYMWEDNSAETFSIALEGPTVQSNYNSGTTGTWRRLGPYQAIINDGAVNLVFSGGASNLSGLEVWRVGAPAANQPPVVANPIADRSTNAEAPFSFTFPTTTFSDPDIGTVLAYSASLSPSGSLPGWLSFNSSTRTFSGTPAIGDESTIQIQVTASDGAGGSISDVFALTINPPAPNQPPVVSNPIADQSANATAPFSFTFAANAFTDPNAGTVLTYTSSLSPSGSLPAWLSFNASTRTFSGTPAAGDVGTLQIQVTASDGIVGGTVSDVFALTINPAAASTLYRAINMNGPALVIDGNNWEAGTGAPGLSYTNGTLYNNPTVPLVPSTDANRTTMIRSCVWGRGWTVALGSIPAGTYQIFMYLWEDNNPENISIALEGTTVQANYSTGTAGTWRRLGPYQATINDGAINIAFTGGSANLSGLEVWRVGAPAANQPPVVANPIADRSINAEAPFSFTFPTTTFSDPDIGTVLAYSASLSPSGSLPGWLSFNASTRTFSGTPAIGDVSTIQIQVTASDGAGGSISDVFALTINPPAPNQPPVVSNPIADQSANATAPFSFTFAANAFTDPNAGTVLTYTSSLSPSGSLPAWLSFNASTRTFSGTPAAGDVGTLQIQVTASDGIVGGTVSDVFALTINPAAATTLHRAININGAALVIDGNNWEAGASAPNLSFTNGIAFANQAVTLVPVTDANRATMIRSSVWGRGWSVALGAVPAGTYQVWIYVWEDNNAETFSVTLEGTIVQSNYNSGTAGTWRRLGPYQATINDGTVNLGFTGGSANLSGLEVWRVNQQAAGGRVALIAQETSQPEGETPDDEMELKAFPNPFSEKIQISFTASESGSTRLAMYDVRGITVRVLFEAPLKAGQMKSIEAAAENLPEGVYVLELVNGKRTKRIKVAISR